MEKIESLFERLEKIEEITCEELLKVIILLILYANDGKLSKCKLFANILILANYLDILREKCGEASKEDFEYLLKLCKKE